MKPAKSISNLAEFLGKRQSNRSGRPRAIGSERLGGRRKAAVLLCLLPIAYCLLILGGCRRHDDGPTLDDLMQDAKDADADKRFEAIKEIGKMGPDGAPAIDTLIAALTDQEGSVRVKATYALANVGTKAELAIPALAQALRDKDAEVRAGAAYALPLVGGYSDSVVSALQAVLNDKDPEVRKNAADSLRNIKNGARFRAAAQQNAADGKP